MIRTALVAACLFALAGPAAAAPPLPDCSGLAQARASAHTAATPFGYWVVDIDGASSRQFEEGQGVPEALRGDHATLMTNPTTKRSILLMNDGPHCVFSSLVAVFAPNLPPIDTAVDFLRLTR